MKKVINRIRQVSFVVADLDETVRYYSEVLGFDQWETATMDEEMMKKHPHYTYGEQIPITFKVAKGMVCNIEFEFMQPLTGDSIYARFLRENGGKTRMHHMFVEVDDFDEAVKEFSGEYPVMQEATTPFGSKIMYFDSLDKLGFALETGVKIKKEE